MALVVISGQPCSGKSTAAACLANSLDGHGRVVVVIDEPSLNLDRNRSYKDMPSEKNLRGLIRSAVDRALSKDAIVILDSLNNIKGYRYELWCLARAAGLQYCVTWTTAGPGTNHGRNQANHLMMGKYSTTLPADSRGQIIATDKIEDSSPAIVEIVAFLCNTKEDVLRGARRLQPTIATQNVRVSETNSLYELNRATQDVITTIVEAQSEGSVAGISVGKGLPLVSPERTVGLPELRRLRRTFLKLAGQSGLSGPAPPSDYDSAQRMFVEYLIQEL